MNNKQFEDTVAAMNHKYLEQFWSGSNPYDIIRGVVADMDLICRGVLAVEDRVLVLRKAR